MGRGSSSSSQVAPDGVVPEGDSPMRLASSEIDGADDPGRRRRQSSTRKTLPLSSASTMITGSFRVAMGFELKFENLNWLFFPGTAAAAAAVFSFLLAFAQGIEPKSQGILMRDAEQAAALIMNPEIAHSCLDQLQSACASQYAALAVFCLIGMVALLLMRVVFLAWYRFNIDARKEFASSGKAKGAPTAWLTDTPPDTPGVPSSGPTPRTPEYSGATLGALSPGSTPRTPEYNGIHVNNGNNRSQGSGTSQLSKQSTQSKPTNAKNLGGGASGSTHLSIIRIPSMDQMAGFVMNSGSSISGGIKSVGKRLEESKAFKTAAEFSPGNKWFWYRAWTSTLLEISLQIVRGFLLEDSYAQVSAGQTLAQTLLIVGQLDVFLYTFYERSEVAYTFCSFYFEIGYMLTRVSLFGPLSLTASSFLDFVTLAGPLAICIGEIYEIYHFIIHALITKRASFVVATKKFYKKRLATLALLVTALGVALAAYIIQTGFLEECPKVEQFGEELFGEERPPDVSQLLPVGVDCHSWQYNLFLMPACSCLYLALSPLDSPDCAGLAENNHTAIKQLLPHLDDLRFLTVFAGHITARCYPSANDLDLFASWTKLQGLLIGDWRSETLPPSFSKLTDLRMFEIDTGHIQNIPADVLQNWPKIETITCWMCPHLESIAALRSVTIPRLKFVEIHGLKGECIELPSTITFICTPSDAVETCPGVLEWLFQSSISSTKQARERTICSEALCRGKVKDFDRLDMSRDKLLDVNEASLGQQARLMPLDVPIPTYTIDMHRCLVEHTRAEQEVAYVEDFDDIDATDYISQIGFLAARTKYTTCADCDFIQDAMVERKAKYEAALIAAENAELNAHPCARLPSHLTMDDFTAVCSNPENACLGNVCTLGVQMITAMDFDLGPDLVLTEAMFVAFAQQMAWSWMDWGIFECLNMTGSCLDRKLPNGTDAVWVGTVMKMGFLVVGVDISDCSTCPYFPQP